VTKRYKDQAVVVFRKYRDDGTIIALFPEIAADLDGHCQSYAHVGQHGAADYYGVINNTRLATPKEYKALARELTNIGYELRPIKRAMHRFHHCKRYAQARKEFATEVLSRFIAR